MTLHRLSQDLDGGDIIAQERVTLPDGVGAPEADQRLAVRGVGLFMKTLAHYDRGTISPEPQDESLSSYFPFPDDDDFRVSAGWGARRLFNFMRGTAVWGRSYALRVADRDYRLSRAVAFLPDARLERSIELVHDQIRVQCRPGVLIAKLEV